MPNSAGKKFRVVCPQCQAAFDVIPESGSERVTCPDCLEEFVAQRPTEHSDPQTDEPLLDFLNADNAMSDSGGEPPATTGTGVGDEGIWDHAWEDTREQLDALLRSDETRTPAPQMPASKLSAPKNPSPKNPAPQNPPRESKNPTAPRRDKQRRPKTPTGLDPLAPYDFTSPCPLCGTRLESTSEKIGSQKQCPDCHTIFEVREPPKSARRERFSAPQASDDDELQLSDVPSDSPFIPRIEERFAPEDFAIPPSESAPPPRTITPADAIRDTLTKAAAEVEEEERGRPPLPPSPFQTGVLKFLFHPMAAGRLLFLSLAWFLELGAIQSAITTAEGGAMSQFASVALRMFAATFGLLLLGQTFASLLSIAQETSHGRDVIEGWPGLNVVEWFFDSWALFAVIFLTLGPGFALGQISYSVSGMSSSFWLFGFGMGAPVLAFVFPVMLLSFLENNAPYSPVIWRSLAVARGQWIGFWMRSAILVGVGCILAWIRSGSSSTFPNLLLAGGMVLTAMIYFRLFGRLAWACEDVITKLDQQSADAGSGSV